MSNPPKFSVIIPLYNKRSYIRRAVDSVLSQALTDFELIVVDDGSTDGSVEELNKLIHDPRLRLIKQCNQGVGAARNTGIHNALANWIAFIDADDMWLTNHLCELKELVDRFPESGLVSTRHKMNSTNDDVVLKILRPGNIRRIDYFKEASKNIGIVCSSTAAVRRDVVSVVGGFKAFRAGEDLEFWARIALSYPVAISDKLTSIYFRGTGGTMEAIEIEQSLINAEVVCMRLRDISPSVSMLCDRAEQDINLWLNSSIRCYVNSRLLGGTPGAIYRGEIESARSAFKLAMHPLGARYTFYRLTLLLPDSLLTKTALAYRLVKWFQFRSRLFQPRFAKRIIGMFKQ